MSQSKPVTKRTVTAMITARLIKFSAEINNGAAKIPVHRDMDAVKDLAEGETVLVFLHQHQLSPMTPEFDELREYRRIDNGIFYKVWKGE